MSDRGHTPTAEPDEGFLARWSRRKRDPDEAEPALTETEPPAAPALEAEPEPLLTDADMPPLDSLDEQSDYSGFLSPGVSEELRTLALRKLFRAASFNVCDGLDDYDDDFTSFAKLGDIVTREMRVRQAIDDAREKAKAALAELDAQTEDASQASASDDNDNDHAAPEATADHQPDPEAPLEEQADEQPIQPA